LSWQYDAQTVSIWTTAGRLKSVRFACSPDALKTLREYRKGESDLIERDGVFYLIAVCEVPEAEQYEPGQFIGVDLGIANIATTSTGYRAAGRGLNRHRKRQLDLRKKLQAKGTKSARRRLKNRRRKEARHAGHVNHIIAKQIVTEAERTSSGIALEDLGGIRQRVRLRKPQRVTLHSWAFHQLGQFVEYKARRAGVPLVYVDPAPSATTSRRRTGSTRPSSFAGSAGSLPTPTGTLPTTSPLAVRLCGLRGVSHASQHLSRCLDGGGHTTASGALPPNPVVTDFGSLG
jgi:IS605 OrfB family transposase